MNFFVILCMVFVGLSIALSENIKLARQKLTQLNMRQTMKTDNRIRGQENTKRGQATEQLAELWLQQAGYVCIERIETPWRIHRRNGKVVSATPKKQVSGDFTAIDSSNGRYVHVEVKSRDRNTLRWSDFEGHQIDALNRKAEAGAVCLILWVKGKQVKKYAWPIEGFSPGKSLKWEI